MLETYRTRIIELDGARGFAVLIVMCYHFVHIPVISGNAIDEMVNQFLMMGWIGVDLFFVLSGFLITRILLHTKSERNYFFRFYTNRTLRIFPLYFLYLAFLLFVFYPAVQHRVGVTEQQKIEAVRDAAPWFWTFLSNIKQFINKEYFGAGASHLWSLAIEEQFYLVWPILVYLLRREELQIAAVGIVVIALLLRIVFFFMKIDAGVIYSFTFTRIDAMAMGGLVALNLDKPILRSKAVYHTFVLLSIAVILLLVVFGFRAEAHPLIYTVGFSFIGLSFSLFILLLVGKENFGGRRFCKAKVLVFLGKYSYALYLFHPLVRQLIVRVLGEPLLIFGSQLPWQLFYFFTCFAISTGCALVSWHLFERYFMKLKGYLHRSALTIGIKQ